MVPYNIGIERALQLGAEGIIIQNAENIHMGDIIKYANDNLTNSNYLSFGCFSIDKENTFSDINLRNLVSKYPYSVNGNGENGWYNHSIHRAVCYDFCAAITRENIIKLNGYDERYGNGIAFGDNDFLDRIRKIGLDFKIIDDPYVIHQWHYTANMYFSDELLAKNRDLFCEVRDGNEYKAKHLITKDFESIKINKNG